jgi:uncharacterized protein (DUF302 family)
LHSRESGLSFADALAAARATLAAEGFGVLCEIDVQATLRANLGVTREPYAILGTCNPALAGRALTIEPELGVLLPGNHVVRVVDGATSVRAVAAEEMPGVVGNPQLASVAHDVAQRLSRVLDAVAAAGGA